MNHGRWYIKGNQTRNQSRARTSSTIYFKSQKSFQCFDEEELQLTQLPGLNKNISLMQMKEQLQQKQQQEEQLEEVVEFRTRKAQTIYKYILDKDEDYFYYNNCLLYTSPSPRDRQKSRMPSSA
eukprot:TRINITY_DN3500_c0_g1_i3.p2 TRINITY_DN3500_c0_g1~~TRINITY_DN3500_c0_g1_i3.p2  ORF type:complete len:124 (-),score=13.55 TRINITY_DN3500_c0_g1_i3:34-405(-)